MLRSVGYLGLLLGMVAVNGFVLWLWIQLFKLVI